MEPPAFSILKNPMSKDYIEVKEFICSPDITWVMCDEVLPNKTEVEEFCKKFPDEKFANIPFFSHPVLIRPARPTYTSLVATNWQFFSSITQIIAEILAFNEIKINSFYRININLTINSDTKLFTPPHIDHPFPHKNFILYLTQPTSGGDFKVYKNKKWNRYSIKEDEAIIFEGMHCHAPVNTIGEKRIAIVATFI